MTTKNYTKIPSIKLFMMRSQDPAGIDAELDRRNAETGRIIHRAMKPQRKRSGWEMVDTCIETHRWNLGE